MSEINNANFTPDAPNFKTLVRMSFQGLTNFPYIEEDFDALTNYGLLSKVVEYLNEVISNNNEQNSLMTGLYNAYVSLQNYVNNYFNNLDVQDEINNKLDEMSEDGSLYALISRFVNPIIEEQNERIATSLGVQNARIDVISNKVDNAVSGSPLVASSTSGMTDTSRVYVNTTDGKWYYYDGDSWEIGGTYQSTLESVDKTLTQSDMAPDSKIVGEKLQEKNFDINYITGYNVIQNPIQYAKNTGYDVVHDISITENTLTFTVDTGQTTKGISSNTFPLLKGKTYTLKFTVSFSDTTNPIKFYYRKGNTTISENITGSKTISTVVTPPASGNDLPVHFFIDNSTGSSVTVLISDLMIFEGTIGNIKTLKDYNDELDDEELYNGIEFETTTSGNFNTNVEITAGSTYKIEVTDLTSNCNFFSSADTSTSVLRVTTPGVYYYTPFSTGYLSTFAFNASNFHVAFKVTKLRPKDVLYVSPTGNDNSNGLSIDTALRTFQRAIDLGARKIIAKRGKYYHQTIKLSGNGEELSIKPYDYTSYTDSQPDRPLIEIINGTELANLQQDSTYSSLLSQSFEGNDAWTAVFITHTLPPSTSGFRGYNNAGLWQISGTDVYSNDKRVNPVLTIDECISTAGTFFWNGTTVYVHPYNIEYESFMVQDAIDYGIELRNLNKLELQDVSVKFSKQSNFYLINCMDMHLNNCISQYTNVINGFQMNNSNGILENCQAYNSRDDGFGAQEYGVTSYLNCIGNYNDDDGISHHYGERAFIIGGEYGHNGKGGVASPTYGAYVNVYNVYTHHNDAGIYATNESESRDYATRTCFVNNCLIINNRIGVRTGGTTKIIGWNNIIKDNTTNFAGNGYKDYSN